VAGYRAGEGYREIDSGAGRTCESAARLGGWEPRVHSCTPRVREGARGGVARAAYAR